MNKPLILLGGGGHCKSVIEVAENAGYEILGILDKKENLGKSIIGYTVIGSDEDIPQFADKAEFLISIGFIDDPSTRIRLYNIIKEARGKMATIIASTAYVSKYATIGEGTVIMHHAFVNADAKIGVNCIINTKACIEHDAIIGNNCHISTGAIINGGAVIEDNVFVGSQSVVNQYKKITMGG